MTKRRRRRLGLLSAAERCDGKVRSKEFRDSARKRPQDFTRNRKMTFEEMVYFMLNMIRSSTQTCLDRFFGQRPGMETAHMTQQSFSEARQKLRWEAFRELFRTIVDGIYEMHFDTWHGYRLSAIDGSKQQLPDDPKLREHFGALGKEDTAATAQASALYDVLNRTLIDVRIVPIEVGERELALRHIERLCQLDSFGRECILYDRGYASFGMVETHKARGISFVMRVKRGFSKDIDTLPDGDHHVTLKKSGHDDIAVRVLKFPLPSGEAEALITDIEDKEMGVEEFKELYFMRWSIETKFDEIKNKLEVENFSGRTVDAIMQDFYATMFMSNIAAIAYWEAQEQYVEPEREGKDNKYSYHANASHVIGTLKDRFIEAMLEPNPRIRSKKVRQIIFLVGKRATPTRPGRSRPRNQSPRDAKFRHNRKSNC
jgi:hypothetical protein